MKTTTLFAILFFISLSYIGYFLFSSTLFSSSAPIVALDQEQEKIQQLQQERQEIEEIPELPGNIIIEPFSESDQPRELSLENDMYERYINMLETQHQKIVENLEAQIKQKDAQIQKLEAQISSKPSVVKGSVLPLSSLFVNIISIIGFIRSLRKKQE